VAGHGPIEHDHLQGTPGVDSPYVLRSRQDGHCEIFEATRDVNRTSPSYYSCLSDSRSISFLPWPDHSYSFKCKPEQAPHVRGVLKFTCYNLLQGPGRAQELRPHFLRLGASIF
jgi:hypothetical protein